MLSNPRPDPKIEVLIKEIVYFLLSSIRGGSREQSVTLNLIVNVCASFCWLRVFNVLCRGFRNTFLLRMKSKIRIGNPFKPSRKSQRKVNESPAGFFNTGCAIAGSRKDREKIFFCGRPPAGDGLHHS